MAHETRISFFKEFAGLINSVENIENTLRMLVEMAVRVMNVRAASLILVDKNTDNLYFYISAGANKEQVNRMELEKDEGIAGWVVAHNEPALVEDVAKDPRWSSKVSQSVRMETQSIACAPLLGDGKVIGVMELVNRADGSSLREEDLEQLKAFSALASATLAKARSYDDVAKKNRELEGELESRRTIIGDSSIIKKAIKDCEKTAESKATTLITGESGTGKELFARLIHDLSNRKNKPMVVINCGALPETLLERELFGHEKGAFTGAESLKPGLFEAADGGTIFLDEIGETTQAMQVKLLRVLQESTFFRLGGQKLITVDVRVVAATNKDLKAMVDRGEFREDLFYRLNVIRIGLPSLRERKGDIPLLANSFLNSMKAKLNPAIKGFSPQAIAAIENYSWPGNIRQLENAIERAVIMSESERIQPEDLPAEILEIKADDIKMGITLKEAQDNFKRNFIRKSLAFCGGNKTKTSKVLEIQRTYLSRLIKELNINT